MSIAHTLWNQRVKVRDGTEMALDVLVPKGTGPFPTVVLRTPYGRSRAVLGGTRLIEHGYATVFVDLRGRGDSGGIWRPFVKDIDDAYDVIEWIAGQPWSTGRVGMIGGSYEGLTQWWAVAGKPPHLFCIVPQTIGCARESDVPSLGTGIPGQYWLWWMTLVTGRTMQNAGAPSWEARMESVPLCSIDERLGITSSAWQSYVAGKMEYLSPDFAISAEQIAAIDIPVLVTVGWWDDQAAMVTWGALQAAKSAKDCRLLIGAWDHAGNVAPRATLGGIDVSASVIDIPGYIEKFLALHLKGETNDMAGAHRCRIFQTGSQRWDDLDQWPHRDASETPFYLSSDGDARSLRGNGRLGRDLPLPTGPTSDQFTYDPNDPARDMTNMAVFAWADPPLDHRFALRRRDILVYDTDVMPAPLTLSGRVRFELFVSSNRVDTDLFTSIYDVHPDGRSIALGGTLLWEGSLRLRYREGPEAMSLAPGEIVEVHINGVWLHHVALPGHRLRVAIASSKFPRCARNAGTGGPWAEDTVLLPQTNTVHHSVMHPSRVLLPIVAARNV
jgi:uncharacterized protein